MSPVSFFKALSDETRLHIIMMIASEHELCVCELMAALMLSQPKISRHLALLRHQGVLLDRRQGQWVFYRINPELPEWVRHLITAISVEQSPQMTENMHRLTQMGSRPERQSECC
ncbi:metalloregulator ArsR/SmtB family transcription factor [uncultured Shewanella sp.]|uniref:metalloregulator ArsR/SmtB family transcription factor n=1 Tax=uncultured Shewanella sp. TaxID=173975 RepID=UPI0026394EAA|nr:metalloregulator ArsR/SmtB family transcription factor [uncultured Shewanella sp.]